MNTENSKPSSATKCCRRALFDVLKLSQVTLRNEEIIFTKATHQASKSPVQTNDLDLKLRTRLWNVLIWHFGFQRFVTSIPRRPATPPSHYRSQTQPEEARLLKRNSHSEREKLLDSIRPLCYPQAPATTLRRITFGVLLTTGNREEAHENCPRLSGGMAI